MNMSMARHHLLAYPGLTCNENRHIRVRDPSNDLCQAAHFRIESNEPAVIRDRSRRHLSLPCRNTCQNLIDGFVQSVIVKRLCEEVGCSELHRFHDSSDVTESG